MAKGKDPKARREDEGSYSCVYGMKKSAREGAIKAVEDRVLGKAGREVAQEDAVV